MIQVEAPHFAPAEFRWGRVLFKLAVLAAAVYYFGLLILFFLAALLVFAWLVSKLLPQGLLTGVAVQLISFLLTRRLMGPAASVPVRDVRVRDAGGQETLVRLQGQLTCGNLGVGDEVLLSGWMRGGMLRFRRGYNKRLRTAIKVKCS